MKHAVVLGILWAVGTASLGADPAVLVNTTAARPLVSLQTAGGTLTADLAPGSRWAVDAVGLSGLGEKNLRLEAGGVYYIARFGALPRWYRLADTQVLAVNRTGRALRVTLPDGTAGLLADGTPVLADSTLEEPLELVWAAEGGPETRATAAAGLYRFLVEGEAVVLRPWAEDSAKE